MKKKQLFSLRKKKIGLCSVILGMAIIGGAPLVAHADSVDTTTNPVTELVATSGGDNTSATTPVSTEAITVSPTSVTEMETGANVETRNINSPVSYIADETKEVGVREIQNQGKDGKLIFEKQADELTVKREEPIETKEIVGTKPTVSTKITKAPTEYRLDEDKPFGVEKVVTKPEDGVETTTTKYRIAPVLPEFDDKKGLDDRIKTWVPFTVDKSKELPSDQIIVQSPDKDKIIDNLSIYDLQYTMMLVSSTGYLRATNLFPVDMVDSEDNFRRYFGSKYISDQLYAQMKFYYEEIMSHKSLFSEDEVQNLEDVKGMFETLTQRYNNSKGVYKVNIDYRNVNMSEQDRVWFERQIDKLPNSIKQNLLKLVVTNDKMPSADKTDNAIAISLHRGREIWMNFQDSYTRTFLERNRQTGTEEEVKKEINTKNVTDIDDTKNLAHRAILRLLLHELSHNFDHDSGLAASGPIVAPIDGFSNTKEFQNIYNKYYKESPLLVDYYRKNPEEAFAEGMGRYLGYKIYGIPYIHYFIKDGVIRAAWENEEHYNDKNASNPFELTMWYYADLYNKLFEQPQDIKVEVATVKKTKTDVQNGLVVYGAKPTEKTIITPFKVIYKSDDSKDFGYIAEVGGKNGEKIIRTSYVLKDNKPEAVEKVLSDIAAVDKVVTKGTKTKTAITDVIPTAIKYVQDATLDKGVEKADDKHVGSRGYTTVTTTYKLNPVTGEITSSETKVVTPMVEKVVYVGTKVTKVDAPKQVEQPAKKSELKPEIKPDQQHRPAVKPAVSTKPQVAVSQKTPKVEKAYVVSAKLEQVSTNQVATVEATQAVVNRRGTTDYQAVLPQTGEADTAVYVLAGLGMIGLAGVGLVNKERRN